MVDPFLTAPGTTFDVRSPAEYAQGHIPGAFSLPLFTDDERAAVGTLYKQTGKEAAIELGLRLVGPKMADLVAFVKRHLGEEKRAKVHCWRGGMRSSSVAWLLETAGISTVTLKGGYKRYRRFVLDTFTRDRKLLVLGGLTGSGKSAILNCLKTLGEQVLDLEQLACHRGSSFGHLKMPPQPSCEYFENEIASVLIPCDPQKPIWIEDESRMVGRCKIPDPLFKRMQTSSLILIDIPFEERLERLHSEYGTLDPNALVAATRGLAKRLGGSRSEEVVRLIQKGWLKEAIALMLHYYDASYQYSLTRRPQPFQIVKKSGISPLEWAQFLVYLNRSE